MNQYIITEERLAEYEEYFAKKKGKSLRDYQEGVSKEIRSHPYNPQAERDCPACGGKLMRHCWCIDGDCGWDSIKELRQGKDGE
jgi:hypothetical protein